MPCYHPMTAYRSREKTKNGKFGLSFNLQNGYYDLKVQVPCGQCIGCKLEKSRQWAIRCVHEAQMHDENCFMTLTYNNENLPEGGALVKRDFQLFMKRLRKECGEGIRYYMCGEYGAEYSRPHYHICLFGYDFKDKYIWSERDKVPLYRSPTLEKLWPFGFSTIGEVTFESAAYVARYISKKLTGDRKVEYEGKSPEFALMSRKKGIGREWYEKYKGDCYPKDFITYRGMKLKPPAYYDRIYDIENPEEMQKIKNERRKNLNQIPYEEKSGERLLRKEKYKRSQIKTLRRGFENG